MQILGRTWDERRWWHRVRRDAGRGLLQALLALTPGIPLGIAALLSIAFLPLGIGIFLAPAALLGVRGMARRQRRVAQAWYGIEITVPYRPRPEEDTRGLIGHLQRCRWLLTDPATWRDLLWLLVNVPVGLVLGLLPAGLVVFGIESIVTAPWMFPFFPHSLVFTPAALALGVIVLAAEPRLSPGIGRAHALFSAALLRPGSRDLAARVGRLTESRTQVIDASAAELRRIERDLHDGAQARLAALGMSIGLAEQLVRDRPEEAVELLAEARASSDQALSELRSLVRGILPPVLAERGLEGAVRALAVSLPVPVDVRFELPTPLSAPQESAVYFAIAEALANVVKHSQASRAWVQLHRDHGEHGDRLVAVVGDDGVGGADIERGSGLRGVESRLAAFDGIVVVTSPVGGPTLVTLELPCV